MPKDKEICPLKSLIAREFEKILSQKNEKTSLTEVSQLAQEELMPLWKRS